MKLSKEIVFFRINFWDVVIVDYRHNHKGSVNEKVNKTGN